MSHVEQICDGYNKKSLMGNWYEERLYPSQPFREQQDKKAREKDQGITCFDGTGFQRSLPRIQRRTKWETAGRIILNDGFQQKISIQKGEYPHGQQQSSVAEMKRPVDKNSSNIKGTNIHPNSQLKNIQKSYHYVTNKNAQQLNQPRDVLMYGSDFRSTLPQHPPAQKATHFRTSYQQSYQRNDQRDVSQKTESQFNKTRQSAGNYVQVKDEMVRNISTMPGEIKKEMGDQKERTDIQRSWVPPKDSGFKYSVGKTQTDFRNTNIPQNDIQTSLNMNNGVHNIHPKNVQDGYFRHVRQDVTRQPNQTFCNRP